MGPQKSETLWEIFQKVGNHILLVGSFPKKFREIQKKITWCHASGVGM